MYGSTKSGYNPNNKRLAAVTSGELQNYQKDLTKAGLTSSPFFVQVLMTAPPLPGWRAWWRCRSFWE
jgi:hypothetical protein